MLDFMTTAVTRKKERVEIYPKFKAIKSTDLMIRGGDFYAIWNEDEKLWSTKEDVALYLIDREIDAAVESFRRDHPDDAHVYPLYMWDVENGMIDRWHKYVQKQCRDQYMPLDEKLIFSNMPTEKKDYASKKLPYPLEDCDISAYEELISTLYAPEERHKLEWAIGAIVSGDSKYLQKFVVMYGAPKTGKSTVINIVLDLFKGYTAVFDSQVLGSASSAFALEAFRSNPLVAIQHDGDMSRIENNARINSLVSHEDMVVNEKFKSSYTMHFNSFLIMGTNKPVRITDSKSGLLRRLIDVSPTGQRIPKVKYDILKSKIAFELGGIAKHCLEVYEENPKYYDDYQPVAMLSASNDFYNFVLDSYDIFEREDETTLKIAYEMYQKYNERAGVQHPYPQRVFKEELKSYFREFAERSSTANSTGTRSWNVYKGFIKDKFQVMDAQKTTRKKSEKHLLVLASTISVLDAMLSDCPAQYASEDETPTKKWVNVKTTLKDIDTSRLHYVKVPENHIVIDFDLKDSHGNKSFDLNAEAAAKWPATYAEVSKGGQGIHLHYIYTGDVNKLSRIYDPDIEIKVYTGNSSLRRRLSLCNDIPVATISSGLPLKEDNKKMIDFEGFKNEKALRTYIKRAINKEYASSTRQSMSLIYDTLEKAYDSGMQYDISDMAHDIMAFASHSSNSSEWCYSTAGKLKYKSEEPVSENFEQYSSDTLVFFDIEVFRNLLVVVYKAAGEEKKPVVLINPSPRDIEELFKMKLIGFNNRNYDNHILYARMLGETNEQLFSRSQAIIKDKRDAKITAANNASYTDIFDFAATKQSLKKWEIALGIHHQELPIPWDEDVPEDKIKLVAEYCINDVLATEVTFNALQGDFLAREILADIAGGTVNDTTNTLTTRLIFGTNRKPQSKFQYRNMALPVKKEDLPDDMVNFLQENFPVMVSEPHGKDNSFLPYFPGYSFNPVAKSRDERSQYRGHFVGEGGFVWSKPGMYTNVVTFDVASMHPSSIGAEYLFGEYTPAFYDLLKARIAIKHKDYEAAKQMFGGKLAKHLTENSDSKVLSQALKIAINSVYGLTAASFEHPFKDPRNIDNIVAKRGALFMVDLLENVLERGGNVIHIKTDSIKVADPSQELQNYILQFGKRYGYNFEIEHKFEKICLVNDAVYIAKCALDDEEWLGACRKAQAKGKPEPSRWTATGTQFAVPYVFKTLFSHEPLIFDDYCVTKSVSGDNAIYIDRNEGLMDGEHNYIFVGRVGQFVPIRDGFGGGELFRHDKNKGEKYDCVGGTKGYRWLESETVKLMHLEDAIDDRYFNHLVNDAVDNISKYGDFEWFRE